MRFLRDKRSFASVATIALVMLAASPTVAYAADETTEDQPADRAGPQDSGEIVVTANKREENLSKVGLTIKALGSAQLEQQKVTSLQDLAVAVPGLTYTQTDSSTPVYTLRGIGFYDTSLGGYPSVSVYLDETPLSFPMLTSQTLFDVQRVEVLKGPQGTLFGNNATGGAINYIAAKPTKDFEAGLSLDYARFNTFTADGYVSGPVADNLLARLAVKAVSGDGWQKSISRPNDSTAAPETFAARFLLDWRPTERLRIQTNLNGWRDRTEPEQAQFQKFIPNWPVVPGYLPTLPVAPTGPFVPFAPNAVNNARLADWTPTDKPFANNRLLQAAVRADYDVTDAITLTSLTSYIDYKQRQRPEGDGLAQERIDITQNDGYIHSFSTELRLADNKNPVFRWTLGGNYSHDVVDEYDNTLFRDSTSAYTQVFAGLPFRSNAFSSHQIMKNYAAFAAAEYTIGQFTLKGGVRYTKADRSSENCNLGSVSLPEPNYILQFFNVAFGKNYPNGTCTIITPTSSGLIFAPFHGTLNQHNVSWRAGVDWKPNSDLLVYFNVAKGFKAGSFPTLSGSFAPAFTPVTQESVLNVEGGIKAQLFDHKLSVNIAGFYDDYRNKQVKSKLFDPNFRFLDALINIPKSRITGFELEVDAHPVPGLTIGGAVTYLDAKLDNTILPAARCGPGPLGCFLFDQLGVQANFNGNPIPDTSKWNVGANFNYTFALGGSTSGFIGSQLTYRSHSTTSIGNEPDFLLPAYTLIDAQAGVDLNDGKIRIMVWGKNLTNKFYLTNVNKYSDGEQRFVGRPVTYGVTLSYKY